METKNFSRTYTVKFRECDPAGIAYFAHIFSWSHDSFEEFLPKTGINWSSWFHNKKQIVPIKHTESDFKKPFLAGETYLIQVNVARLGESSFTMRYQFRDMKNESLHAEVLMTHVFLNADKFEKISIPEDFRKRFQPYLSQGSST